MSYLVKALRRAPPDAMLAWIKQGTEIPRPLFTYQPVNYRNFPTRNWLISSEPRNGLPSTTKTLGGNSNAQPGSDCGSNRRF
jgi:hypothetical protein